jgi:hypothetical protein
MIEKWLKAGPFIQCPNKDCKHKRPAPELVAQQEQQPVPAA